ncbi:patatin-like phospholipase family protein [Mangrovibacillus cuniculi]|uniref:Patatin-like phospholipase family protein n=1 Tax=Mangrovibacillus cuniculi TaxID=2593652 RepID=A0A7S8CBL2_9BACI|nr:patatin-like phospholipase family protein [Mangrovibacillus cuniculi]QPC46841.1 patatin-like phospholipase family protein [Mangrovibacillus cuniculi]
MKIDAVFSGGGIRGFALIGAYQELCNRGYKIERAAGTSAGSIIAALAMAGYTGEEMVELVQELDVKTLLHKRWSILPSGFTKWILYYWKMGLYKGDKLEEWLEKKLAAKGVYTFADVKKGSLKIIASDLTNERILVLPDDLEEYGIPSQTFTVARAVRMSCTIPFFFEPVKQRSLDGVSYIVDGGILSNLPMWAFDEDEGKKVRPLIGINLNSKFIEDHKNNISNAFDLFTALFATMRVAHDHRYIEKEHVKNIVFIEADNVIATDFEINDLRKESMIKLGKERTKEFLNKWTR